MNAPVGSLYYDLRVDTANAVRDLRQAEAQTKPLVASFNAITAAVKVYAAALALLKSVEVADDMRLLSARVLVATGSVEAAAVAMERLVEISARTQTSVAATVQVFTRLNQSILQMGGSQAQTLKLTELLGMAIKVGGANAQEASSAMLQFGQALGSGKLAGDELRSLLENAPYLMRQLADGIGVPVAALKGLGEQGKLTADVVVNALSKAASKIEADFQKMPQTLSGALTVAEDAFKRLNKQVDDNTQKSAILTGAVKGLGDVFDALSKQIEESNKKSAELNRDDNIKAWADRTKFGLSYVLDVADKLRQITNDYARANSEGFVGKAARGLVGIAKSYGRVLGIGGGEDQEPTTAGARMRKTWSTWNAGADSEPGGYGLPDPKLKPLPALPEKSKFDSIAYLAKLREATADEYARIGMVEQEALRQNARKEGLTLTERAEAAGQIQLKAAQDRIELAGKVEDKILADATVRAQAREQLEQRQASGRSLARSAIAQNDPKAQAELAYEGEAARLQAAYELDKENFDLYAEAKAAAAQRLQERLQEIRQQDIDQQQANNVTSVALMSRAADQMYSILESSGRARTDLGKALFAVSKALAVAEIILNTEVAASKAGSQLGVYGIPMATLIRAQGYASAGMVAGMAIAQLTSGGGRQYGGPVSGGSLYRVNETGAPEMFTAANGSQFMLPTADGRVTPAGGAGGGTVLQVQVINNAANAVSATASMGSDGRTAQIVISQIVEQIDSNAGPVMTALKRSTNVRSTL